MRFQVTEYPRELNTMPSIKYMITDIKMERTIAYARTKADAALVSQALELQEVKTLEQMKLPLKKGD